MLPYFYCRIACSVGLNSDQMEEGEQYSEYSVESNPRAYMTMRDYRNQWMSAPVYSVPSTYAPPVSPHLTSTSQPPQLISPVEKAILNLKKLVDNFKEEQRVVNVQANQEIEKVENSLNKDLDVF